MLRRFLQTGLLLLVSASISALLLLSGLEYYLAWQSNRIPSYHGAPHPGVFVQNEIWGYNLKPNVSFRVRHPEFAPEITTNSLGFRGGEDGLPVRDGDSRHRAVILGDSFMMGMSLGDDEVLVSQLAALRPGWAFWNFGIDDWGTTNEAAALRHFAEAIQPRLAIVMFYENDFRNNGEPLDKYSIIDGFRFRRYCPGTKIPIPEDELMANVERVLGDEMTAAFAHPRIQRLCRVLRGTDPPPSVLGSVKNAVARFWPRSYRYLSKQVRLDLVRMVRRVPPPLAGWIESLVALVMYVPPELADRAIPEAALERTRGELRKLQEVCLRHGCELKVVIIPERGVINEEVDPSVQVASQLLEELGIDHHDPRADIVAAGGRSLYWVQDSHLRPEGNRVLAESMAGLSWFQVD